MIALVPGLFNGPVRGFPGLDPIAMAAKIVTLNVIRLYRPEPNPRPSVIAPLPSWKEDES